MGLSHESPLRFSVVIPTLNEEGWIERCIARVRTVGPPAEVVVADGGSKDGTVRVAERLGARTCAGRPGRGPQCNAGAALASGDVLVFLHADVLLPEDAFDLLNTVFQDDRVQIGTFNISFDVKHRLLSLFCALSRLDPGVFRFGDQCMVVRKPFFHSLGGFPDWRLFEDLELVRRARQRTRICRFPATVTASGRRFLRNGVVRQQVLNVFCTVQYLLGVPPDRVADRYETAGQRASAWHLLVFLRFPRPGRVKTRLGERLGDGLAAELYRLCAEQVLEQSGKLSGSVRKYACYADSIVVTGPRFDAGSAHISPAGRRPAETWGSGWHLPSVPRSKRERVGWWWLPATYRTCRRGCWRRLSARSANRIWS